MAKHPYAAVTASELALLQILWEASRPLNKQEILERATIGEPLFAKNSFHVLINELIAKGYLVLVDSGGIVRKRSRRYAPTVSCNEFLAIQIHSSQTYRPSDIPDILSALLDLSTDVDREAVVEKIEQFIKKEKDARQESDHT